MCIRDRPQDSIYWDSYTRKRAYFTTSCNTSVWVTINKCTLCMLAWISLTGWIFSSLLNDMSIHVIAAGCKIICSRMLISPVTSSMWLLLSLTHFASCFSSRFLSLHPRGSSCNMSTEYWQCRTINSLYLYYITEILYVCVSIWAELGAQRH